MTKEFKAELKNYNLRFKTAEHVADVINEADAIYMECVVQPDYTKPYEDVKDKALTPDNYKVTREPLGKKAKPSSIILHSLPRMDKLPPDVDITRHSRYWQEAFNGVVLKMGLLSLILGAEE